MNTTEHIKERLKQDLSPGLREALEKALKAQGGDDYQGFYVGQELDMNGDTVIVADWEDWLPKHPAYGRESSIAKGWVPVRYKSSMRYGPYVYKSKDMRAID